jgi:hypothetical protein
VFDEWEGNGREVEVGPCTDREFALAVCEYIMRMNIENGR